MRLQKATYCALYAVLELARYPELQLSATDIADKYNISANHLAKVLRDLGRARLVESVRGAGGGYRFAGNLKRTTLYDVISIFEDVQTQESSLTAQNEEAEITTALDMVLGEIDEIAVATLGSITIGTLLKTIERHKNKKDKKGLIT